MLEGINKKGNKKMDINELDEITSYELNDFLNTLNNWNEIEILEDWEYKVWQDLDQDEVQ